MGKCRNSVGTGGRNTLIKGGRVSFLIPRPRMSRISNMNLPSRFVVSLASACCFVLTAAAERTRSFDQDWRFLRGDAPGAEAPSFDDSGWRTLDVPHDYSIEDLPPRPDALPELEAASGEWRFKKGDDEKWKAADLDDGDWRKVTLPGFWEGFGQSEEGNVYGQGGIFPRLCYPCVHWH